MAKQKRKEQRAKERIAVTLQLILGEDDDLIQAIAAIPNGGRQAALKNVLRQSLGMPIPASGTSVEIDVESLEREIYQRIYERVKQEALESVEKRLSTAFVPPAPPSVEAAPQLDQQTANERKNRLRGANW